jgi:ribose transport system substrate-binding protein
MMRFNLSRALALVFASLVLVGGCGRQSGKTRVAFISNNPHQFWIFAQRGSEQAAKEEDIEAEFKMPPKGNAEEQRQFIEDLLVRGIQGIAISPNDSANMVDFFRLQVNPKVPLLMVDNDVLDPKARRAYVGTHNYRAGRAAGELVKKAIPDGGKVVIFVGKMDAQNAVERRQGVLDVLAGINQDEIKDKTPADARDVKLGKYTLVDTRTDNVKAEDCQREAEDILQRRADVAALVGLWEYNPPALLRAADKMKSKVAIIGFDENEDTLRGIESGRIIGTIVQAPYKFGYDSVKILAALARKDESVFKKYPEIDSEHRIFIPHRTITKENVAPFHAEVNKMLGK